MTDHTSLFGQALVAARDLGPALLLPAANQGEAEDVELLVQTVRRWCTDRVDGAAIDAEARIPREVLREAAELGLFSLSIPEAWGGAGMSMTAVGRVVEELARYDRSVATTIGLHCGLGLRGLIGWGSEAQKARWLPSLASGEILAAFAATESEAGSHIAGLRTTGVPQEDGSLCVDGEKIFVTNGGLAGLYTIVARTPGLGQARNGTSLLVLDPDLPGLTVGPEEHKLGLKGSSTTTLAFDGVALPADRVLGEPGAGLKLMGHILAWGRTLMSAGCLGTARAAAELAFAHVQERRQFGRPLAGFDQVRRRVARMRVGLQVMDDLLRLTTGLEQDERLLGWVSSVTKIAATEGGWEIIDDALQLHGGVGYIEETGIARMLRDARITRIFEGANDVLRLHVAAGLLEKPGEIHLGLAELVDPALQRPAAGLDALLQELGAATIRLRKQYRLRVFDRQLALAGLADATIAALSLQATLLRADAVLRGAPSADRAAAVALEARYAALVLLPQGRAALVSAEDEDETDLVKALA